MWKHRVRRVIPGPGRLFRRLIMAGAIISLNVLIVNHLFSASQPHVYDPHLYQEDTDYPSSNPASYAPTETPLLNGRIFIASIQGNSEHMMHAHWTAALIALVNVLGKENVYVSIYEYGSTDNTKNAVEELKLTLERMVVNHTVVSDTRVAEEEIGQEVGINEQKEGWVLTKNGKKQMRRLPLLADLKNKAIAPLEELRKQGKAADFDRILWLGSVVFTPQDVLNLLKTRGGNYTTACSLDFDKPYKFFDSFAFRDIDGREAASLRYPFFGPGRSRNAILRHEPVPMKSCWNGLTVLDAQPFIREQTPLQFRAIPDSLASLHIEGSETCLLNADNEGHIVRTSSKLGKEASSFDVPGRHGVWLNPRIRVGNSHDSYWHSRQSMDGFTEWFFGMAIRFYTGIMNQPWRDKQVVQKLQKWEQTQGSTEKGWFCLVDMMQVMIPGGWRHV